MSFAACNLSTEKTNRDEKQSWSYELSENGCSTGRHVFSKKDDYCLALLDDQLNKFCASRLRAQKVEAQCPEYLKDRGSNREDFQSDGKNPHTQTSNEDDSGDDDETDGTDRSDDPQTLDLETLSLTLAVKGTWSLVQSGNYNMLSAETSGLGDSVSQNISSFECIKFAEAASVKKLSGDCNQSSLLGIVNKSKGTIQVQMYESSGSFECRDEANGIKTGKSISYELTNTPTCSGNTIKKILLSITN